MQRLRRAGAWIADRADLDRRDTLGALGLALLGYGAEMIHAGWGYALAGAVMVAIAVLVD